VYPVDRRDGLPEPPVADRWCRVRDASKYLNALVLDACNGSICSLHHDPRAFVQEVLRGGDACNQRARERKRNPARIPLPGALAWLSVHFCDGRDEDEKELETDNFMNAPVAEVRFGSELLRQALEIRREVGAQV
jgi:hypothetical protein